MPGLGAFAMTTSLRPLLREYGEFSLEDSIGNHVPGVHANDSSWPWHSGPSTPKIISHDQGEDEPCRSQSPPQRTANLRFPNARIITHRHLNDTESRERPFQNYFNRPAIRVLLELKPAKDICSPG